MVNHIRAILGIPVVSRTHRELVLVEGMLKKREWEDHQNGLTRSTVEIVLPRYRTDACKLILLAQPRDVNAGKVDVAAGLAGTDGRLPSR